MGHWPLRMKSKNFGIKFPEFLLIILRGQCSIPIVSDQIILSAQAVILEVVRYSIHGFDLHSSDETATYS
jgi:hypothetical protein